MKNAFLTGSHAYGTPHKESDIDIVLLMSTEDMEFINDQLGNIHGSAGGHFDSESVKSGGLNLIIQTNPLVFAAWKNGTEELIGRKPVTRDEAVECIKKHINDAYEATNKFCLKDLL